MGSWGFQAERLSGAKRSIVSKQQRRRRLWQTVSISGSNARRLWVYTQPLTSFRSTARWQRTVGAG